MKFYVHMGSDICSSAEIAGLETIRSCRYRLVSVEFFMWNSKLGQLRYSHQILFVSDHAGCTYLGSPARFESIARFVDKKSLVFFGRGSGAPQLHPRSSYGNFPMHPSRLLSASMMSSNFARHVADDRRPQRVLISRNDIALGRGSRPL